MELDLEKILDKYILGVGIKRQRTSNWSRVGAFASNCGTIEYYVATYGYSFIYVDVVNGEVLGHMID